MKRFLLLLTLGFSIVHAQQFSRVDVYDGFLPTSISVDPSNNLILAGGFLGTVDFDPGSGSTTLSVNTYAESAISKYDENGVFQWVSAITGGCDTSFFQGNEPVENSLIDVLATDQSGNVYVGGRFCGTADFDPGSGTTNLTAINAGDFNYQDAFLAKYNPSGALVWAGLISGNGQEELEDLRIDASGNLYISGGNTQSADIDPGSGVTNISGSFFAKIDANGNLIWVKQLQGPAGADQIAPASDGTIYLAGNLSGTTDFDPGLGVFILTPSSGQFDIFMAKFDSDGDFIWALSWDQPGFEEDQRDLQADMTGHVYLSGYFRNTMDMDPGAGTFDLTSAGSTDDFIVKLDSAGDFVWAVRFGNSSPEFGVDIKVENDGTVYFMNNFNDRLDVDPGPGTLNLGDNGDNSNVYFGKLDPAGALNWGLGITGFFVKEAYDLAFDGLGNLYYSGNFEETVDFDPGTGVNNVQGGTLSDPFGYVLRISGGGQISAPDENAPLPFHLYPNPTYGSFTIDLGSPVQDVVVSVSTIDGKLVWQESYGRISKVSCAPDLPSGMYLLKVEGKGKTPTYSKLSKR